MTVIEAIEAIKAKGGVLSLEGEQVRFRLAEDSQYWLGILREQKAKVSAILKARGGRVANFPRCPRCASYALYRRNNVGNYECLSCGLREVSEVTARSYNDVPVKPIYPGSYGRA